MDLNHRLRGRHGQRQRLRRLRRSAGSRERGNHVPQNYEQANLCCSVMWHRREPSPAGKQELNFRVLCGRTSPSELFLMVAFFSRRSQEKPNTLVMPRPGIRSSRSQGSAQNWLTRRPAEKSGGVVYRHAPVQASWLVFGITACQLTGYNAIHQTGDPRHPVCLR